MSMRHEIFGELGFPSARFQHAENVAEEKVQWLMSLSQMKAYARWAEDNGVAKPGYAAYVDDVLSDARGDYVQP